MASHSLRQTNQIQGVMDYNYNISNQEEQDTVSQEPVNQFIKAMCFIQNQLNKKIIARLKILILTFGGLLGHIKMG